MLLFIDRNWISQKVKWLDEIYKVLKCIGYNSVVWSVQLLMMGWNMDYTIEDIGCCGAFCGTCKVKT